MHVYYFETYISTHLFQTKFVPKWYNPNITAQLNYVNMRVGYDSKCHCTRPKVTIRGPQIWRTRAKAILIFTYAKSRQHTRKTQGKWQIRNAKEIRSAHIVKVVHHQSHAHEICTFYFSLHGYILVGSEAMTSLTNVPCHHMMLCCIKVVHSSGSVLQHS